ncbi:N(G),N(G)-dimethylarginine dimethylaminohydrolase 1 [Panulirus ornatus]|uniref:N(G),N(G)-dimethylarginine dimethylaminohydrolase 1 n=1 Tax=Panulirus ornatus TaxID=150431 RepID=UPI003A8B880A
MFLFFWYTHAIVCRIPESFKTNAVGVSTQVDLSKARKQHETYVATLREIGLDVIELPADENHPDCTFVEDVAVVCNGTALLTRPGHPSREKEVYTEINLSGKEFFVGLSSRTNQAGACALASAFPEFPCTPIKVEKSLHLKSAVTMAGPDVICVGNTPEAKDMLRRIEREATFRYQTLTVPDEAAANVLFANGFLIHKSADEHPASAKVFEEKLSHWNLKPMAMSELAKANGSLTCCSILIRKTRHLKNIM